MAGVIEIVQVGVYQFAPTTTSRVLVGGRWSGPRNPVEILDGVTLGVDQGRLVVVALDALVTPPTGRPLIRMLPVSMVHFQEPGTDQVGVTRAAIEGARQWPGRLPRRRPRSGCH